MLTLTIPRCRPNEKGHGGYFRDKIQNKKSFKIVAKNETYHTCKTYFLVSDRFLLSQSKNPTEDRILPLDGDVEGEGEGEREGERDNGEPRPRPDPIESSRMVQAFIMEHSCVTGLKISGSMSVPSKV